MRLGGLQACSLIDYPGHISAVVFTIGCNFRCPYCHNPELVDETAPELTEESFFSFLENRNRQLEAVTITGGEPTLQQDLVPFISQIKKMGFKVKLDTNGTKPGLIKELQKQQLVDYFAMDIKSPLAHYEATTSRPVDTDKIRQSIAYLMQGGIPYEFRTTVVKALLSPEDILTIGQEIAGASQYFLQRFTAGKLLNPGFVRKTTYSDEELSKMCTQLQTYVNRCEIR